MHESFNKQNLYLRKNKILPPVPPSLSSLISGFFPLNEFCISEKRQEQKGPRPLSYLAGFQILKSKAFITLALGFASLPCCYLPVC